MHLHQTEDATIGVAAVLLRRKCRMQLWMTVAKLRISDILVEFSESSPRLFMFPGSSKRVRIGGHTPGFD